MIVSQIPVIDVSGLISGTEDEALQVATELDRTARDVGFMYLKNHGISSEDVAAMKSVTQGFLDSSAENKKAFPFNESINFGYHSIGSEALDPSKPKDQKETFTMRNVGAFTNDDAIWPSGDFKATALRFFEQCRALSSALLSGFARKLNLPQDYFDYKHTGLTQTLRLLHYPPAKVMAEGQLGAGAHTDYGTTTFVFQDNSGGLEVQTESGEWIEATPIKDTAVVNTGDLLSRWTNDCYRSTPHRVQVRPAAAAKGRLSIAFFNDPGPDVMIETLPSCITPERPSRYASISAHDHIMERIAASNM